MNKRLTVLFGAGSILDIVPDSLGIDCSTKGLTNHIFTDSSRYSDEDQRVIPLLKQCRD